MVKGEGTADVLQEANEMNGVAFASQQPDDLALVTLEWPVVIAIS
jgi:hypothetical protein